MPRRASMRLDASPLVTLVALVGPPAQCAPLPPSLLTARASSSSCVSRSNTYATTIHAINSTITKTSVLTKVSPLYKGLVGGNLPDWFWSVAVSGVHGHVDAAFTSASVDKTIASDYSQLVQNQKAAIVFEIHQGLRDRGAQLEWLSQWPHEREVVLPPMSGLEVQSTRVDGVTLIISCNLAVNLKPATIEQIITQKQQVVRDACEQYILRTVHAVEHDDAWEAVRELHPDGGARKLVKQALQRTYAAFTDLPATDYAADDMLCAALQSAVKQSAHVDRWAHEMRSLVRYLPNEDITAQRNVQMLLRVPTADFARRSLGHCDAIGLCGMLVLNRSLTSINLLFNEFDLADAKSLADIAKWREPALSLCGIGYKQTEATFVGDVKLRAADVVLISADLVTRPALAKLVVDENPFGLEGGEALCEVLASAPNSPLRILSMANTGLGPEGGAAVARVLSNRWTGLQQLQISFNRLGVEGAAAIARALQVNSALTALNLHYNTLEDEGTEAIIRALQANSKSKLASLTLSSNSITSLGAAVLADALASGSLPALCAIDLSWNKIGHDGGQALVDALEMNASLSLSMSLRSCALSMEVQAALTKMQKSTAGRRLEIVGLSTKA